jgi:hypothetical protein
MGTQHVAEASNATYRLKLPWQMVVGAPIVTACSAFMAWAGADMVLDATRFTRIYGSAADDTWRRAGLAGGEMVVVWGFLAGMMVYGLVKRLLEYRRWEVTTGRDGIAMVDWRRRRRWVPWPEATAMLPHTWLGMSIGLRVKTQGDDLLIDGAVIHREALVQEIVTKAGLEEAGEGRYMRPGIGQEVPRGGS